MSVRDFVSILPDGGQQVHRECRDCGENVTEAADNCPACGGDITIYEL